MRMKKAGFLIAILSVFCILSWSSAAEMDSLDYSARDDEMPQLSTPQHIAMVFHKLVRRTPDFDNWARLTDEYKEAADGDKGAVREQQIQYMKGTFVLLTLQEPLVVGIQIRVSKYSASSHGFFIESFKEETFFPARYAKQAYAIIPGELMDRQWMSVTDEGAIKTIEAAVSKSTGGTLPLFVTVVPKFADGAAPAPLDGENFWLMSGEIQKMAVYDPDTSALLWQSEMSTAEKKRRKDLLDLRR